MVVEKRCAAQGFIDRSLRGNGFYLQHVKLLCTSTSTTQNCAVQTSRAWLFPNMITAANVTVNGKAGSCNGFSGNFFSVNLGSDFFQFPPPLGPYTALSARACYPMMY